MSHQLDHHHKLTVQKIYGHPLNHNIQWHDVASLLGRFGEVHESHRGNWALTRDGNTVTFGPNRHRDLSEDQVIKVRHFLTDVGVTPETLASL